MSEHMDMDAINTLLTRYPTLKLTDDGQRVSRLLYIRIIVVPL